MNPIWLFAIVAAWYVGKSSATAAPVQSNPQQPKALPAPTPTPSNWALPVPTEVTIPPGWAAPKAATTPAVVAMPEPGSDAERTIFGVLPDEVRPNVVAAYREGTNPDKLDELATQLESTYPAVAAALHARAAFLRAKINTGS
jgi:hypothetical protein